MVRGSWRVRGTLTGLFVLTTGFIAYVIAPASILPIFVDVFRIDKATASASISAVFLTWALLQIPGGFLLDRFDNRWLLIIASAAFATAAAGGLLAPSYPLFLLTRLVTGLCAVFVFVGSVNILNRTLPDSRRALGVSLYLASPPVGIAIAQSTGPRLTAAVGWEGMLLSYILLGVVGLAVFVAMQREPVTGTDAATVGQLLAALRNPAVLLVSTASFATYALWTFLNTWMPTYGTEVLGIELAAAGATTALVPLAGIVARPGGGWISDRLDGRLAPVIIASFVLSILLVVGLSLAPSPLAFAGLLALSGAAVNLPIGLYFVYIDRLTDAATAGTSLAVLATFSQVGNLVAPFGGGWLIDSISWGAAFGFAAVLAVAGIATIVLVVRMARH